MDDKRVQDIAELTVRRYFDTFKGDLADILKAERHHMHMTIEAHDAADEAHGGVERKFNRAMWMVAGLAAGGGGTVGALLGQAFSLIGG